MHGVLLLYHRSYFRYSIWRIYKLQPYISWQMQHLLRYILCMDNNNNNFNTNDDDDDDDDDDDEADEEEDENNNNNNNNNNNVDSYSAPLYLGDPRGGMKKLKE